MGIRDSVAQLFEGLSRGSRANRPRPYTNPVSSRVPTASVPSELPPRFRVRESLGRGGMGVVVRAYDSELGHDVALKSLNHLDGEDLFHLKNEFRALSQIRHPNLVDLYELFVTERGAFFTMELVPGTNLVEHARPRAAEIEARDFRRFRDCARQLAVAINAVHAAGKLHRDVKPSNVRVTPAGRVVLLDFGLAETLRDRAQTNAARALVGTVEYMPPEQAHGEALTTAADWYSFGAALFEAVTGRLPMERPLAWLLGDHSKGGPSSVSTFVRELPPDLDELITQLLTPNPETRPTGSEVLRVLGATTTTEPSQPPAPSLRPPSAPFEGRQREFERLIGALEATRGGSTSVVEVRGPSGIGKTELVRRFTERAEHTSSVVLTGRCHPQEQVAFNALDGIVDELSRWLDRLPREQAAALLPRHSDALAKLFPVLGRVTDLVDVRAGRLLETAHATRARATRALKELLASIADRFPLVVWIDDAQWGDDDSGKVLREILNPPDAPHALVILSYRSEDRATSKTLAALESMDRQGGQRETIELAPLTDAETVVLLSRLFASEDAPPLRELEHLAKEAEGLPFFAHELARYLSHTVSAENAPSHLQLGNMLRRRVEGLPDDDRRLLEIVSIAGGPIEHEVAGLAARATGGIKRTLTVLERSSFIRSTSIGSDRRAEIYHHKLRETVIAGLAPETRRSHHCAIADAILTTATPNLSRVVDHYDAAGERDAVRRYVVPAAKQAASLFAFERAAGLYRRAVEVGSPDLRPWELYARLGDALSECGRGREAGEAFERAADLLPVASERDHGVFLRRRSAEQYLQSGQWTRAPRALDRVLEPLGIEMPQSTAEATYRIVVNRVRAEFRLRFSSLATTNAPIAVADRAELLRTLTQVYSFSDYLTGMAFASQLLADALEVGDPRQIMLGLALESVIWASTPGGLAKKQADRLLSRFTELLSHAGPFERAGYHNCKGMISWYAGDFLEAVRCLDLSPAEFRTARRDVAFYLAVTQSFRFPALAHLGRISLLSSELEVQLLDAEARGDNYFLAVAAQGHQTLAWLAADRPDRALYWRDRVLSILPAGFTVSHQMCTVSKTLVHLYRGDGHEALAAVESAWPNLRKLQFLRMPYFGEDLRQLRARALLSAASAAARRGRPEEHLVRRALEVADEIALDPAPHAVGHAALIRAGAAVLRGEHRRAQHLLADALDCFDLTNLRLYAETTRLALGNLSSEGGDVRRTRALEWMKSEGISNPRALAETMAPGCFIP